MFDLTIKKSEAPPELLETYIITLWEAYSDPRGRAAKRAVQTFEVDAAHEKEAEVIALNNLPNLGPYCFVTATLKREL